MHSASCCSKLCILCNKTCYRQVHQGCGPFGVDCILFSPKGWRAPTQEEDNTGHKVFVWNMWSHLQTVKRLHPSKHICLQKELIQFYYQLTIKRMDAKETHCHTMHWKTKKAIVSWVIALVKDQAQPETPLCTFCNTPSLSWQYVKSKDIVSAVKSSSVVTRTHWI